MDIENLVEWLMSKNVSDKTTFMVKFLGKSKEISELCDKLAASQPWPRWCQQVLLDHGRQWQAEAGPHILAHQGASTGAGAGAGGAGIAYL